MKKFGVSGSRWLKIVHLVVMILMLGGIISTLALRWGLDLTSYDEVYHSYRVLLRISDNVIRWGAQGLLVTGLVYGIWTNWGWFKYKWITVKWIIFMGQTIFGIFFIDRWMVENMSLLESEGRLALSNPIFLNNHWSIQIGATVQTALILFLVWVSVVKPWKKKAE